MQPNKIRVNNKAAELRCRDSMKMSSFGIIAHVMAYDLHIERADESPIALNEWRAAVEATEGVRLFAAAAHTITNPKTGELISIGAREGDTEVLFPDTGEWHSVFRWRGESAVVAARFDPTETSHPAWRAAVGLATRLGAVIRGDEGEVYDFQTGEVTDANQALHSDAGWRSQLHFTPQPRRG